MATSRFGMKSPWEELPDETDFMAPQAPLNAATNTNRDAAIRTSQISSTRSPQANAQQGAFANPKTTSIQQSTPGWTSQLGPLGRRNASMDEGAFFNALGQHGMGGNGFQPGGVIGGFLADEFNPRFLAAAANPGNQGGFSYGDNIMQQSGIMTSLMGKGTELDPAAIVGNTISALMSVQNVNDLEQINPALAAILNASSTDPTAQLQALLSFLGQAMAGSMPSDMLQSWLVTVERIAQGFQSQMNNMDLTGKGNAAFDLPSLAKYLAQQMGPTLGL